jgi:hypothetical protein
MLSFRLFCEELKKQEGSQMGSNPGGVYHDSNTGEKKYVKFYKNPEQGKVEALTSKIYNHMGIKTLNPENEKIDDKEAVTTKWNDKVKTMRPSAYDNLSKSQANQIGKMYHGAILTKNWDIVGLEHDNIVKHEGTGDLHSIDHGGAFHFRAQGGPKNYTPDISEHESLRNNDQASGHVFKSAFRQHPEAEKHGLEAVKKMDDNHIHHLFKTSGISNWEDLHSTFMDRKKALLKLYN